MADLYEGGGGAAVEEQRLFGLREVGHVALVVGAAHCEAAALPKAAAAAHEQQTEAQPRRVLPRLQLLFRGVIIRWMDGWMDGWMDSCIHAFMHASIHSWIHGLIYSRIRGFHVDSSVHSM